MRLPGFPDQDRLDAVAFRIPTTRQDSAADGDAHRPPYIVVGGGPAGMRAAQPLLAQPRGVPLQALKEKP